ncbi:TraK domain-containing protein, partial [Klebsiella pneumoniae]|uniref:TraK domain-containing protein n=1 Tax=Klebsiella pneumoniae TaxID=573 RepID=UPI002148FE8C
MKTQPATGETYPKSDLFNKAPPLTNGGQANIAVSNTDPNLFTVPGDRITAINSLDGGLTNQEQTDSGGAILATVSKKPFTFIVETERGLNFSIR